MPAALSAVDACLPPKCRESSSLLPQLHFQVSTPFDREIWALFVPALFALVLEPVQAMADTAIIGQLGVEQLGAAGLGKWQGASVSA